MRRELIACVVAGAVCVAPLVVSAKDMSDEEKRALAKQHYDEGLTHYNLGEFDEAITEFKAAYALTGEPGLLFNIAQAYRLKEDYKQALYFYRTYLRVNPEAPNKADVEHWIEELKDLLAKQKDAKEGQPQEPLPNPDKGDDNGVKIVKDISRDPEPNWDQPSEPPDQEPRSGRKLEIAGWTTGGLGIVMVGTAVYFSMAASDGWDEVNSAAALESETWNAHLQDVYDTAERDELTATILYVAGGAAVVTGGVLWYLGWSAESSAAPVALVPTSGGAEVVAAWAW